MTTATPAPDAHVAASLDNALEIITSRRPYDGSPLDLNYSAAMTLVTAARDLILGPPKSFAPFRSAAVAVSDELSRLERLNVSNPPPVIFRRIFAPLATAEPPDLEDRPEMNDPVSPPPCPCGYPHDDRTFHSAR